MNGAVWVALLNRIPPTHHDSLVVVTTTGTELMVQKIFRMEDEFMIMRARLAGSTDQGRIIVLPFDQINNVAINKPLLEKEVQELFGEAETTEAPASAARPIPEPARAETPEKGREQPAAPSPVAEGTPGQGVDKPSKSVLLSRLRARLGHPEADKKEK